MGPTAHCDSPPPASGQSHGRPTLARPLFSRAPGEPQYGRRGRGDEGRRVISLGLPGGAAAFCGPGGPAKPTQGRGPKAPAPALCALCAPAAPPETLEFLASHTIHPPTFSAPKPAHKTSGPLPMSGPPAHFAGNPEKFISWFSPLFFKSGGGGVGASSFPTGRRATALANCGRGRAAAL